MTAPNSAEQLSRDVIALTSGRPGNALCQTMRHSVQTKGER